MQTSIVSILLLTQNKSKFNIRTFQDLIQQSTCEFLILMIYLTVQYICQVMTECLDKYFMKLNNHQQSQFLVQQFERVWIDLSCIYYCFQQYRLLQFIQNNFNQDSRQFFMTSSKINFKIRHSNLQLHFTYAMQPISEQSATCSSTSYVSSSVQSQNLIYYYTHFELFSKKAHSLAYNKYNQFLIKVLRQLGDEWRFEANKLLPERQNNSKPSSGILFENAISIWLQINKMKKHKSIDEQNQNVNYDMQYFDLFLNRLYQRLSEEWKELKQCNDQLRQLAMGFFITACCTWEDMVKQDKRQSKGLLQSISDSIQKQILFNPLMLAKQKIFTFFNKRSKIQQTQLKSFNPKNFTKFKQNLQQQELEYKMDTLKINQDQQQSTEGTSKRKRPSSQKRVVFQKIPEHNPINHNILRRAYSFVMNSFQQQKLKWQVGRNFVTNILQINYDKLMNKIKGQSRPQNQNINVRVLKPAEDFYHILMEVWLLFRSQRIVKFQDYLIKVKTVMGQTWSDNYLNPTKLFFSRLYNQWDSMLKGKQMALQQDQEIIDIFVQRVKDQMKKNWQKDMIQKTSDLSHEVVTNS